MCLSLAGGHIWKVAAWGVLFVNQLCGDDFTLLVLVFLNIQNSILPTPPDNAVGVADVVIITDDEIELSGENPLIVLYDVITRFPINPRSRLGVKFPHRLLLSKFVAVQMVSLYKDDFL